MPKPDGYTGTGADTNVGVDRPINFQLTSLGNNVVYCHGFAQQKITANIMYDANDQPNDTAADGGWVPADANDPLASRFASQGTGGVIQDLKRYNDADPDHVD